MRYSSGSRWKWIAALLVFVPIALLAGRTVTEGREDRSKDYFHFVSAWGRYWPFAQGRYISGVLWAPLSERGVIGPVTFEVEPRVHLYVDGADWVGVHAIFEGAWEKEEWDWIEQHLKPGSVFVDIGAHIGTYSQRAAKAVGEKGLVIAVEPNPATIAKLRQGVAAAQWNNITVIPVACGDRRSRMTLFEAPSENTGMASLSKENAIRWGGDGNRSVEVDVIPLDEIYPTTHAQRLDVLKIDTEGAETMVLRGSAATIAKYRPAIMVESVDFQLRAMNSSLQELDALLTSYGYSKLKSNKENALWVADDAKK